MLEKLVNALSDRVSTIDPDRITPENIAYVLHCWHWMAKLILETAVRRGEFAKNEDGTYRLIERA